MNAQSVTLHLPEAVMRRARQAATVLQRPVEEVLSDTLAASLPDVEDTPPDMQAELARMTWFSDQELWAVAQSTMSEEQQEKLRYLTELQAQRPLTQDEQETLEALRQEYGRVTLRKARAYALLSLRGGRSPSSTLFLARKGVPQMRRIYGWLVPGAIATSGPRPMP